MDKALTKDLVMFSLFQICYKALTPDLSKSTAMSNRMLFRRTSDPHRKKREVVYSKGLVR